MESKSNIKSLVDNYLSLIQAHLNQTSTKNIAREEESKLNHKVQAILLMVILSENQTEFDHAMKAVQQVHQEFSKEYFWLGIINQTLSQLKLSEESDGDSWLELIQAENKIQNDFKQICQSKIKENAESIPSNVNAMFAEFKKLGILESKEPQLWVSSQTLEKLKVTDKAFKKKKLRWMTKTFYEQRRFNLFQENPEGFSILISEIMLWNNEAHAGKVDILTSRVKSIIGEYELDPLRVCDIILDVFTERDNSKLLGVLSLFSKANISLFMKSRLESLSFHENNSGIENSKNVLKFSFELIRINLLSLEEVWNALSPENEDDIFFQFLRKEKLAFEYFESNFVVMIKHNEKKKAEDLKRQTLNVESFKDQGKTGQSQNWGKLWLFEIFFKSDYTKGIDWVLQRWAGGLKIDWTIKSSLFAEFSGFLQRQLTQAKSNDSCLANFLKYLRCMGSSLGLTPALLQATLDFLFKATSKLTLFSSPQVPSEQFRELIVQCILPATLLVVENEQIWCQIFAFMQKFEIKTRFSIYENFFQNGLLSDSWVRFQCAKDLIEIKRQFKNMIDKKVKKTISEFSALANRNPFLALHYSIREVKEFSNLRNPVLNNLSYINDCTLDIAFFMVLRQLSERGLKIDNFGFLDANFTNLSLFAAGLAKRHYKSNFAPLVIFAFNKFSSEQDKDFSFSPVLLDLFESLSGIKALSSPNPGQIVALRGGPYLLAYRSNFFDNLRSSKKSFRVLCEILFSKTPSRFDSGFPENCLSLSIINASRHSQRLLLKKSHCSIFVLRKWADILTEMMDLLRMIVWTEQYVQSKDNSRKNTNMQNLFTEMFANKYNLPLSILISLVKLQSPCKMYYTHQTFSLLEKHLKALPASPQLAFPSPANNELSETQSKKSCSWLAALFWMFNIDDIGFSETLYITADKEINDLRFRLKKELDKLKRKDFDNDDEKYKDKKEVKKEIEKLKKMGSMLEKEKKQMKKSFESRRELFYKIIFQKYSEMKQKNSSFSPPEILKMIFQLDTGFLGLHLLPRIQLSYSDAVSSAFFLKSVAVFKSKSLVEYIQLIDDILNFIIPSLLTSTQKQSEFLGVFIKEFVGDIPAFFASDSMKPAFKFSFACLRLPESLFSCFLASQDSLNSSCPSFLEQKNLHLSQFTEFAADFTSKCKKIKKELKDSSYALKILTWKLFEKMTKNIYQLLARDDFRTSSNIVRFLNISGGFFPFTQTQADSLISLLKPKQEDEGDCPEGLECRKLCQSYSFFLLKKTDEEEFIDDESLLEILSNSTIKKEKKVEVKTGKETPNPVELMEEGHRKERKRKGKKRNREKRQHRKRERSPVVYSPLNKRSDQEFKSGSPKSQEPKHPSDQQLKKEKLQSKLRKLREKTRTANKRQD